jgi:hypothetical protein
MHAKLLPVAAIAALLVSNYCPPLLRGRARVSLSGLG